ncbi:SdrD B-like domain-containing protein [Asanoa sp. NPDC050611]|uniref:SdrD B-like domain-containing protein n=1 Tax=Asanoa sp. NPDC050611 TaxID=3157098 RepID=UPI0034054CF3
MRSYRALLAALLSGAGLALLSGSPVAAAPGPADLVVDVTASPTDLPPDGGPVDVTVALRNTGGAAADDVTVKLDLPAGAQIIGEGVDPRCQVGQPIKCRYGRIGAGTEAAPVTMRLQVPAGAADATVAVVATAATKDREASTANNTDRAQIRYVDRPDLLVEVNPTASEISTEGGLGARAGVSVAVRNHGTRAASDIRVTIQPPPSAHVPTEQFDPAPWRCDVAAATWTCTLDAMSADPESNFGFVYLPLQFPAGTAGDSETMTVTATTADPELTVDNNTARATFRYVDPPPADIDVYGVDVYPSEVRAGEPFKVSAYAINTYSFAHDVRIRVPLPETVTATSVTADDPGWSCPVPADGRSWECVRDSWDMGGTVVLTFDVVAAAGTPDGTLTFTATATRAGDEPNVDNNTASGSTTYVAEGAVRGVAWRDLDSDGQRASGEPIAAWDIGRILFVREGTTPTWDTPIGYINDRNGDYRVRLAPGRYVVEVDTRAGVVFTTPDAGDDATDSDITQTGEYWDHVTGRSAVVEVVDGGEVTVDMGVVPTA